MLHHFLIVVKNIVKIMKVENVKIYIKDVNIESLINNKNIF
jgi:hypothetical protein